MIKNTASTLNAKILTRFLDNNEHFVSMQALINYFDYKNSITMDKKRIKELEQDIVRQRFADIMRDMNNGTITQEAEKKYQEQLDYQAELEDFQEWLSGLNLWQKLIYLFFDKLYYFPRRSSLV